MLLLFCLRLFPKFFLDTQSVLLYNGNDGLNSFLKPVSERFLETVSETKKGPTNGPKYGFKILTYQNQFCQGSTSKIHNHFPIPELWRIRGEKFLLD